MGDSVTFQSDRLATVPVDFKCATERIDGEDYQRIKLIAGGDGVIYGNVDYDKSTNATSTITYPHKEAHGGRAYLSIHSALAADTEAIEVRIQASNTTRLSHMTIHIDSALAATTQLWKDTTKTDAVGNRLGALNRRFDSLNVTGMTNCHTPGGTQTGDATLTRYIGSTSVSGKADVGGGAGSRGEFILDQNSAHLIVLTSRVNNNALTIELDWYEHTDKNL
jgi:hypothetical protein